MIQKHKVIRRILLIIWDIFSIYFAYFISFNIRYNFYSTGLDGVIVRYKEVFVKMTLFVGVYIILFILFKQYKTNWLMASVDEFAQGILSICISVVIQLFIAINQAPRVPLTVIVLTGLIVIFMCMGIRIGSRILVRFINIFTSSNDKEIKKVLIVGAGNNGALVVNEFKRNPKFRKKVVAFVDDDKEKVGTYISGVLVEGKTDSIEELCIKKNIDEIIIAISNDKYSNLKRIIDICNKTDANVKIIPTVKEFLNGDFAINKIRDVDVEDLLGREAINLDIDEISKYIEYRTIIVTGGGGSIGSELCRQIARFNPKMLVIFDIYENNAYEIENELNRKFPKLRLKTLIGSVRDKSRLEEIFSEYKPDVVFHAAAHKHVPLMEDSPGEAIKNNVVGTLNTVELAHKYGTRRFVLISTDKAVNPTNVMGASKRLCEMIVQAINRDSSTEFVAVRFGNVLGSNGSVVPLFKKQITEGGPITLTHKDITRYFMTIPEAAQLVLQAGAFAEGGEIFILDMGEAVKIYDLAVNLIKLSGLIPDEDIEIKVIGLRPGEKLYEELLMDEEGLTNTSHSKIYIGKPREYDLSSLKESINELMNLINSGRYEDISGKLREIVPTYRNVDEVNEVAATTQSKAIRDENNE